MCNNGYQRIGKEDRNSSLKDLNRGQRQPTMTWKTRVKNNMKDQDLQIEIVENRMNGEKVST